MTAVRTPTAICPFGQRDENHEQNQHSFDLIREMQAVAGPVGASFRLGVTLDRFVDSVYFDRSERKRGIQLADLLALIIDRHIRVQDSPGDERSDYAVRTLVDDHIKYRIKTYRMPWP